MKIINIDSVDINQVALELNKNKIMVFPTDTVYGLGGRVDSRSVINKIFKIKGRDQNKALSIFVSSIAMAKKYVFINKQQERFLKKYTPGKLTTVLKSRGVLPKIIEADTDKLGIRLIDRKLILALIKKINIPLIATSANLSNRPSLQSVNNIENYFKISPDIIINGGKLPNSKGSTVVDLTEDEIKILRQGDVKI